MAVAFINHHRRDLIGNFQSLSPSAIPSEPFTIAKALDPTPNSEMAQEQAIEAMPTAERMKMMPLVEGPPRKLAISNLMSPPEPARLDQFHQTVWSSMPPVHAEIRQPLSPPISPLADKSAVPDHTHSPNQAADPILYPSPDRASSPRPLFLNESSRARLESARLDGAVVRKTVDAHMAARSSSLFRAVSPPGRDDYELVLYFKSDVMAQYSKDPKSWLERERALLRADQRANQDPTKMTASVRKPISTRISKPAQRRSRPHTFDGDMPMLDHHRSRPHDHERANIERPIRVAPAVHVGAQPLPKKPKPLRKISTTPEPRARIVAPNREDKDFDKLPDCCPPLNTLPNNPTCLKVEWKGNPLNLDDDPHRNLLHPAELNLASKLRLDCATYLTSKRRIFLRLVECVKIGKEFRKTDAQQACKIDVNKASKLWMAYEQVGWLDRNRVKRLAMDERFAMVPAQGQWGLGQH